MPITVEQLRAALTEHAGAGDISAPQRIDGVRQLVTARRRRRTGLSAAGLAAVLVAVIAIAAAVTGPRPAHPVPPANPTVHGMPEYAYGGRQIGSTKLRIAPGTTRLFTVTPSSYGLTLAAGCSDGDDTTSYTIRVNGHSGLGSKCAGGAGGSQASASGGLVGAGAYWRSQGVRLGAPSQISVTVSDSPGVPHRAGLLAVALYQAVPLADYPFPRAPRQLATPELDTSQVIDKELITLAGGAAVGTWTSTVPYRSDLDIAGATTAPGLIMVLADGKPVDGHASWDYVDNSFEITLPPSTLRQAGVTVPKVGAPLKLTIQVSRFASPSWRLWVGRSTL
jgi:hypothetical protein